MKRRTPMRQIEVCLRFVVVLSMLLWQAQGQASGQELLDQDLSDSPTELVSTKNERSVECRELDGFDTDSATPTPALRALGGTTRVFTSADRGEPAGLALGIQARRGLNDKLVGSGLRGTRLPWARGPPRARGGAVYGPQPFIGPRLPSGATTRARLDWSIVSKAGETRAAHVAKHGANNLQKPGHGVFYGDAVSTVDDAWAIAQRGGVKPTTVGGVDIYSIPRPNSGYSGGFAGQGQNLNTVTIITQKGTKKIITGFPGNGLPTPKP